MTAVRCFVSRGLGIVVGREVSIAISAVMMKTSHECDTASKQAPRAEEGGGGVVNKVYQTTGQAFIHCPDINRIRCAAATTCASTYSKSPGRLTVAVNEQDRALASRVTSPAQLTACAARKQLYERGDEDVNSAPANVGAEGLVITHAGGMGRGGWLGPGRLRTWFLASCCHRSTSLSRTATTRIDREWAGN